MNPNFEIKGIVLALSHDGNAFFPVIELKESSLLKLAQAGNSFFQIIESFLKSGYSAVMNGTYSDFQLQICNGNSWYTINHLIDGENNDCLKRRLINKEEFKTYVKPFYSLTLTERKFLNLSSQGMDEENIGKVLGICLNTVKAHRKRVYRKMRFNSKIELIKWCEKFLVDTLCFMRLD